MRTKTVHWDNSREAKMAEGSQGRSAFIIAVAIALLLVLLSAQGALRNWLGDTWQFLEAAGRNFVQFLSKNPESFLGILVITVIGFLIGKRSLWGLLVFVVLAVLALSYVPQLQDFRKTLHVPKVGF